VYIGVTKLNIRACINAHQLLGQEFKDLTVGGMFLCEQEAKDWQNQSLATYRESHNGKSPRYNEADKTKESMKKKQTKQWETCEHEKLTIAKSNRFYQVHEIKDYFDLPYCAIKENNLTNGPKCFFGKPCKEYKDKA